MIYFRFIEKPTAVAFKDARWTPGCRSKGETFRDFLDLDLYYDLYIYIYIQCIDGVYIYIIYKYIYIIYIYIYITCDYK